MVQSPTAAPGTIVCLTNFLVLRFHSERDAPRILWELFPNTHKEMDLSGRECRLVDVKMRHPDPLSRKDLLLSHGECQQAASSCQPLHGLSQLQRTSSSEGTSSPDSPHLSLISHSRNIKAQPPTTQHEVF